MIDFACKEFDLRDIIKCSLALTRADLAVFEYLLAHTGEHRTEDLAKRLKIDLSTVQRAVKKLHEKGLVRRVQTNLAGGGYVFSYRLEDKKAVRAKIMGIVHAWVARVESEFDAW